MAENLGTLASADDVRMLVTGTRERLGNDPAVVALAAMVGGKPVVIVATNQAARDAGQRAGALAKQAAGILGGGGGGKDDLAQGGGTIVSAIPARPRRRSRRPWPADGVRHGVRVGVDVGTARIGVARSDAHGMLATPVETVDRGGADAG